MNDILFVKGQGGLARNLPNNDHKSGFLFYAPAAATLPVIEIEYN